MVLSEKKIARIYFTILALSIYFPTFQVYDKATAQLFYISLINTLTLIIVPFYFKNLNLKKYLSHPLILTFFGFIVISILSILKSINVIESFVRLFQIITFFISLLFIIFFSDRKLISINHILIIIFASLIIDMFFSLIAYIPFVISGTEYTYDENYRLIGLYGNRNILATIICFKIPFILLLALRKKSKIFNIISILLVTLAFFNISLLSSRATYLSIILCVVFFIVTLAYTSFKNLSNRDNYFEALKLFFIPLIISFVMSNFAVDKNDEGSVLNRVSTITSENDVSKNTRLRYYTHAITHTLKNPLLGGGIGNWKIISIRYDSENIQNYIIPYNAHNDILEAFAETGIFGGLFFLLFFLCIPYYLFKNIKDTILDKKLLNYNILLILPFIIYFVDLNLNFPSSRASNQVFLLLYLSIIFLTLKKDNAKT